MWQDQAACQDRDSRIFFPEEYEVPNPTAFKLCARCPVVSECLDHALEHDEIGIWGGLTRAQRLKISKQQSRVRCPDCRSQDIMDVGRHEICLNCGLSWSV